MRQLKNVAAVMKNSAVSSFAWKAHCEKPRSTCLQNGAWLGSTSGRTGIPRASWCHVLVLGVRMRLAGLATAVLTMRVPERPSIIARSSSGNPMTPTAPGVLATKSATAVTFGSMLPAPNSPAAR